MVEKKNWIRKSWGQIHNPYTYILSSFVLQWMDPPCMHQDDHNHTSKKKEMTSS